MIVLTTQNLLTSVVDEDVAFNSLAVLYFTFAVGNLLSSGVVARVPVRLSLVRINAHEQCDYQSNV